ncbi:hypothetical protein KJ819_03135 [Patescibacteria group bacterium]|nr:hypothetical protein [Patescibacteria group bacterium]MBU1500735.1 hypothetical protein [Patescibacteria group bacterium]MBU2080790.1 hypothetical protein [Patescibacteria group bacterium]MBU2123895.1 hypothetical protein [Patescibacteria group bacterium]MBU2194814.1 hypothetical protein [Patescibacteria group bacterium]
MHRTILVVFLFILLLAGIADSWYLYQSAVTDTALTCEIGGVLDGCNIVAQSPYSQLFGIPLALYGVLFYMVFFILAGIWVFFQQKIIWNLLHLLAIGGVGASAVFVAIQLFLIKAICVYCLASAAIAVVSWGIVYSLRKGSS